MSEIFDKPDPPWLAPNDRWRWLGFMRGSSARIALIAAGVAVLVAFGLGAGWGVPKGGSAVAAPRAEQEPPQPPTP